jgi:cytochrome c5
MNMPEHSRRGTRTLLAASLVVSLTLGLVPVALSQDNAVKQPSTTNAAPGVAVSVSVATNAPVTPAAPKKAAPRPLSGAELYSIHCNRCHPERYPTERTAAQWKTIMMHMRVRANLPAEQSRTILKYLQENSGR